MVERATPRKQHISSGDGDTPSPMVLTTPPPPSQKQRWQLRSMWELASIINFFNVFRSVLDFKFDFSFEELESALLSPNALLDDIHIALLKAIPPISRTSLNRETWVMMLCKKLKGWWSRVADGPFPLVPYHGEETATYKELDPDVRVIILKALCEARLDQEDMRSFIDDTLKQGAPYSTFRRERIGIDMQGTTYWYENNPVSGQRLYRELRKVDNKVNSKLRGRQAPLPATCYWETLATNLEEFQAVADKLSSSRNRIEAAIGRRIINDIIPILKDLQKKKERALKKQQRQAFLLDSFVIPGGLAAGRSRRERKPVTYTFDDYDKSISDAIKIIRRPPSSPESFVAEDSKVTNGFTRQLEEEVTNNLSEGRHFTETASQSKLNEGSLSSGSEFSPHGQSRRRRHHRRPQRYSASDFVEAVSDNEADAYSEDEIEGEAVYDDDYVQKRKRRKSFSSSDGDEEYRGDEDDDEEEDDDDDVDDDNGSAGLSDDGDNIRESHTLRHAARGKRRGKLKSVKELQWGLRRSKRATRSNVDYSKYEESDMEVDEYMEDKGSPNRIILDTVVNLATSSENRENGCKLEELEYTARPGDINDLELGGHDFKETNTGVSYKPINRLKAGLQADTKPIKKPHRYLDLNVAAPVGGIHDDSSAGHSRGQNGSFNQATKAESSDNDESTSDSPKTQADGLVR